MRSRSILTVFAGVSLILFFVSQVLAQAPITGWDKAKFGMSPEELKDAYKKEQMYRKDKFYHRVECIERHYQNQPKRLKFKRALMGKPSPFWQERKEHWSREEKTGFPLKLTTSWFEVLGWKSSIDFIFVDNKLGKIRINVGSRLLGSRYFGPDWWKSKERRKERRKAASRLLGLRKALVDRYGSPLTREEKEREKIWRGSRDRKSKVLIQTNILTWADPEGDMLKLQSYFNKFSYEGKDYNLLSEFTVEYSDKELMQLWRRKESQWKKEVAQWEKRGEKMREKEIESF